MLYRLTDPMDQEEHPKETVSLSGDGLTVRRWVFGSDRPKTPTPARAEAPPNPDAGVASLRAEIECTTPRVSNRRSVTNTLPSVKKLLQWSIEKQTVEKFPYGRFGLWFPPDATLTHDPTIDSGYAISDIEVNGLHTANTPFIIIKLGYYGKPELHDVFKDSQ